MTRQSLKIDVAVRTRASISNISVDLRFKNLDRAYQYHVKFIGIRSVVNRVNVHEELIMDSSRPAQVVHVIQLVCSPYDFVISLNDYV